MSRPLPVPSEVDRIVAAQALWVTERFGPSAIWEPAVDVWTGDDWTEVTSAIPGGWLTSTAWAGREETLHHRDCATPPIL
jgi:hypothetical protein